MDPSDLEARLKSLSLRRPSPEFGKPETLAEVLRQSNQQRSPIERIKNMPWKFKSAGIAGMALSVAVVYFIVASTSSGSVAFAQVISNLKEAKTLSFDVEVRSASDGKVLNRSRSYYMLPGKHRNESRGDDNSFAVFDAVAGKVLMVDGKSKIAMISELKGGAEADMATKAINGIKSLKLDNAKPLGEKRLGTVQVKGFEFDRGHETTTVWTNAATSDLVQIDIVHKNAPSAPTMTVWTNIKLDEQFDPVLFSVNPPAGYTLKQFPQLDVTASPANFVAGILKAYAKRVDKSFPEELQDVMPALKKTVELPKPGESPSVEVAAISFNGAATAAIIRSGKRGELWQYYPGVTFGEEDKIVAWIYDRRKKQHSAVYGDLRVEVVAKEDLPKSSDN